MHDWGVLLLVKTSHINKMTTSPSANMQNTDQANTKSILKSYIMNTGFVTLAQGASPLGKRLVFVLYYLSIYFVAVSYVFCMFALGDFVIVFLWYVLVKSRNTHSFIYYIFRYSLIY